MPAEQYYIEVEKGRRRRVSSFAAIDEVLHILADKTLFPNLTRVTIVGHSAGGQFV